MRSARVAAGVRATYKRVDTCAAEFDAKTPYMYSTYESECEAQPTERRKVVILGGGPNRIGQGIEFDYCCCQAAFALRQAAYETILGFTPYLLIASFCAYLVGEFLNSFVLARMKVATSGRWLWTRTIGSTIVGD